MCTGAAKSSNVFLKPCANGQVRPILVDLEVEKVPRNRHSLCVVDALDLLRLSLSLLRLVFGIVGMETEARGQKAVVCALLVALVERRHAELLLLR